MAANRAALRIFFNLVSNFMYIDYCTLFRMANIAIKLCNKVTSNLKTPFVGCDVVLACACAKEPRPRKMQNAP